MKSVLDKLTKKKSSKSSNCWKLFEELWHDSVMLEFVCCKKCHALYKHSSSNGTRVLNEHQKTCEGQTILDQHFKKSQPTTTTIGPAAKDSIKEAQVKLSCGLMIPFKAFENDEFHHFCDKLISIGAKYGPVPAKDILYGRHTISDSVFEKEALAKANIIKELERNNVIDERAYCISTDVWTSNFSSNSYLDFHVTWFDKTKFITTAWVNDHS